MRRGRLAGIVADKNIKKFRILCHIRLDFATYRLKPLCERSYRHESIVIDGGVDEDILDLYFARDERAITETDARYGQVCMKVFLGILASRPDAEECVNDTYLEAWNRIPPPGMEDDGGGRVDHDHVSNRVVVCP